MGFCVAITKNGGSIGNTLPAMLTFISCIASSMADWVLGVARLISSARQIWVKIGPF